MITAVDTSVLLDVIMADPVHGPSSRERLKKAYDDGALIVSDVVYAELAPQFASREDEDAALIEIGIRLVTSGADVAFLAGQKWGEYRKAGGSRTRLLADFLIGAHAKVHAERLVTRDRGFYREYFADLRLLEE
jgi:predicted nucleic acid-binding protein